MSYTVEALIAGQRQTLTYDEGLLTGDDVFVRLVKIEAQVQDGRAVGPVGGPYTTTRHLESSLSAMFLIRNVVDSIVSVSGDLPTPPKTPKGVVL